MHTDALVLNSMLICMILKKATSNRMNGSGTHAASLC